MGPPFGRSEDRLPRDVWQEAAQRRAPVARLAADPPAKTAWGNARDGAVSFGHSVKGFFTKLFSN
jgi:hypothetical protein